jgi:hypothetical protein
VFHLGSGFLTIWLLTGGAWAQTKNLEAVATLKFYAAAQGISFPAGANPTAVLFDGSSIWVASGSSPSIKKLRASDGAPLATFATPDGANGIAFDGANIWLTHTRTRRAVTKMRASDGAIPGTWQWRRRTTKTDRSVFHRPRI